MSGEKKNGNDAGSQQEKHFGMATLTWICVVVSILSSIFLFALDNTIVADIQPKVIQTLGDIEKLPWVSVSFALGGIAVTLIVSKLFGQFDNKILFIAGVLLFEVGSALCGAAPTMDALIVGRAICGVGGAGIYMGALNLISAFTTEAERPLYLSFIGLTWGAGTVLGPIIGGLFSDSSATWRWAFYINLCIGAIVGPVYIFLVPSHNPRPGVRILSRVLELDLLGAVLNAGAFVSLVMAIAFGGGVFDWNSGQIIGLFTCSGVLLIMFVCQQTFAIFTTKAHRIFPVELLKNWELDILFIQTVAANVLIFIPIYFIPLYFQFVVNETALKAGIRLLPFIFFEIFGVVFSGSLMGKIGYYMPFYLIGGILSLVGSVLLSTTSLHTSTAQIYGYSILLGIGTGLFVQAGFAISQGKVTPDKVPLTVAFIGCGQITGIALALSISNTVFLNQATRRIAAILPQVPKRIVQGAISGTENSFFRQLTAKEQEDVLQSVTTSIAEIYYMAVAAAVVTIALSIFMRRGKIFAKQNTETEIGAGTGIETETEIGV